MLWRVNFLSGWRRTGAQAERKATADESTGLRRRKSPEHVWAVRRQDLLNPGSGPTFSPARPGSAKPLPFARGLARARVPVALQNATGATIKSRRISNTASDLLKLGFASCTK